MKQKIVILTIVCCLFFGGFTLSAPVQSQDVATYMLSLINNLRASLGLHPYTLNGALTVAAQNQASWMAISEQISHTQPDGSTPRTRAQAAGYASTWVSENIYMGTSATADIAFQWWINSPIHYRGLTNVNYTEIGIAMSEGPTGYKAYVLVFGNPDNTVRVAPPITTNVTDPYGYANQNNQGNGTSGSGAVADNSFIPPPFVVGVDNNGYIMHEVQPGDTFAGIVLTYGYDWADIGRVRDINSMTEADARWLDIGAIILIPPWEGTYTPTPGSPEPPTSTPTAGPTNTEGPSPTPTITSSPTITYTPSPTNTPTETLTFTPTPTLPEGVRPLAMSITTPTARPIVTPTLVAEQVVLPPPQTFTSASPTPLVVAQNNPDSGGLIAPVSTAPQAQQTPASESDSPIVPLLLIVVGLQVVFIGIAGLDFMARRRKKG